MSKRTKGRPLHRPGPSLVLTVHADGRVQMHSPLSPLEVVALLRQVAVLVVNGTVQTQTPAPAAAEPPTEPADAGSQEEAEHG